MADKPQIAGLPPGAELKPIEGLPEGAEVRPIGGQSQGTSEPSKIEQLQRAFDVNTADNPNDSLLQTGLKSATRMVGAPLVHPWKTLQELPSGFDMSNVGQQLKEAKEHPENRPPLAHAIAEGVGGAAGGLLLGKLGSDIGGKVADVIPTTAKAGRVFESLNQDLADRPVPLRATQQPLQRVTEIGARGGKLPSSVNSFLQRSQSPIDMTFPEARDYQSNLSSMSREDAGAMNGPMRGGVKQLNKAFFEDIKNAAGERGPDYSKAMRDYRIGSTVGDVANTVGKIAVPAAIGGGAYKLTKALEGGR